LVVSGTGASSTPLSVGRISDAVEILAVVARELVSAALGALSVLISPIFPLHVGLVLSTVLRCRVQTCTTLSYH